MDISEKEFERRMVFAKQEAEEAWVNRHTIDRTMLEKELIIEFAKILVRHMYEPHLGCARTSALQAEINARDGREESTIEAD